VKGYKTLLPALARICLGPVSFEAFQYASLDPYQVARKGFDGLSKLLGEKSVLIGSAEFEKHELCTTGPGAIFFCRREDFPEQLSALHLRKRFNAEPPCPLCRSLAGT
jgi:hypothetical protein